MRYGSLFSGIEAASLAWRPLGWECAWVAEIDPFCRALLKHHYPDVPNLGDVNEVDWNAVEPVDVIVGGSPCQSFSVAGKRLGLDDPRGNLAIVYLDVVRRVRPRWMVFENVPGLLSSDEGRDFGTFLGLLGELGFGFSWRILDAQWSGVPQRRRRLWVVGHSGGQWQRAAAVLFDGQSLHGDPPPGRQAGERVARPITPGSPGGSGYRNDADTADNLIAFGGNNTAGPIDVATACNAGGPHGRLDFGSETFIAHSLTTEGDATEDSTGRGAVLVPVAFTSKDRGADAGDTAPTLQATRRAAAQRVGHDGSHANGGGQVAIATFDERNVTSRVNRTRVESGRPSNTLHEKPLSIIGSGVRRLTPVECERLMAMPDNYTLVPYRGKPAADGPRYKAIGNSMVVSEVRWIGERIGLVNGI